MIPINTYLHLVSWDLMFTNNNYYLLLLSFLTLILFNEEKKTNSCPYALLTFQLLMVNLSLVAAGHMDIAFMKEKPLDEEEFSFLS